MGVEMVSIPRMIPFTFSRCSRSLCTSACFRSRASRLVAIIDDEGRLVHVEMGGGRRIVEVVIGVQGGRTLCIVCFVELLVALAEGLGGALQRLLDLLLAFLVEEGLELCVRGLVGRLLRRLELLELVLGHCPAALLLHFLVLSQQLLLEVLVLRLRLLTVLS